MTYNRSYFSSQESGILFCKQTKGDPGCYLTDDFSLIESLLSDIERDVFLVGLNRITPTKIVASAFTVGVSTNS
jgi:hypothetical protein